MVAISVTRSFFVGAKVDFIFNFHKQVCSSTAPSSGCQVQEKNDQASVHQMLIGAHLVMTF